MKVTIHITKFVETIEEARFFFESIERSFAENPTVHVNAIVDENLKHPYVVDTNQKSNPFVEKKDVKVP